MENKEIKKALECWIKNFDGKATDYITLCNVLDLINRQQAEIERLSNSAKQWEDTAKDLFIGKQTAKAEAIKEFAERLKEFTDNNDLYDRKLYPVRAVRVFDIDNLVKEMGGEDK